MTVRVASPTSGTAALDLCSGTGDLALALARAGAGRVVGTDFVPEMLEVARRKAAAAGSPDGVEFDFADAQDLPFGDGSFDVVTVGFGVRNLPDRAANFREVMRVLRPGGRYLILEFTRPPNKVFRALYHAYLRVVVPALGALVAGDRDSYQYLGDSIRRFPDQAALGGELRAAGFSHIVWRDLAFGIVALHVATK